MKKRLAGAALGLVLALAGCSPPARPGEVSSPVPDPGPAALAGMVLERAFASGGPLEIEEERVTVEAREIGRLRLRSGRLLACDPFSCERARPFAARVPRGEFPLQLAMARLGRQERVALARLSFLPEPVVRWEPARFQGGEEEEDGEEGREANGEAAGERGAPGVPGYGVDSGTGAFMDAAAWREYQRRMAREPRAFRERLHAELDRNDAPHRAWAVLDLGPGGVALFSSGEGDGGYASYWGYDRHGRLAALLTDFRVLSWEPAAAGGAP